MDPDTDEMVALYAGGRIPTGAAPRSQVRAQNLRHAATAVVVRDVHGRVYVHRRTTTKDVFPGRYDFCAGGVVLAGEDPDEAAVREAEEELGVRDVPLQPIGEADYADEHTRYHAFLYETTYDGPVRWQPEEVAWGEWVTLERLATMLSELEFVPDTPALLCGWLAARQSDRVQIAQGWDSVTSVVEGRWLDRRPRRPEVAPLLLRETRLMPLLAPRLPLPVPVPVVLGAEPLRVRHRLVIGSAVDPGRLTADQGAALGRFLRALHAIPVGDVVTAGLPEPAAVRALLHEQLDRFAAEVVPKLPDGQHTAARQLLAELRAAPTDTLVHGDLGPDHLLVEGDRLAGVIDWGDAHLGDPAVDLSWTLHGTSAVFADALAATYSPSGAQRRRALLWHRLGPWHEVTYGLDTDRGELVESGLAGVLARLPREPLTR